MKQRGTSLLYPEMVEVNSIDSPFSWIKHIDGLSLFAFTFGTVFLYGYGEQRVLGIIMVVAFFFSNVPRLAAKLRPRTPVPPEMWFYTAWVAWAGLTGLYVAKDEIYFQEAYIVTLQMLIMVWTVYAILRNQQTVDVTLLALMAGSLVQIVAIISGASDISSLVQYTGERGRALGLSMNPNYIGLMMIFCVFCALSFWHYYPRMRLPIRILIVGITAAAVFVMLASGSRKSLIAITFLIIAWMFFADINKNSPRQRAKQIISAGMIMFLSYFILPIIMDVFATGYRLDSFLNKGQGHLLYAIQAQDRYNMYVDGFWMFIDNPIFGVGLNNFQVHYFERLYSHSDYMEPLATTGLIGFALYQAFYVLLLTRSFKLLKTTSDTKIIYRLKMIIIGILTIMIVGFGSPHYTSQPVFILLTTFSVYTWNILWRMRLQRMDI